MLLMESKSNIGEVWWQKSAPVILNEMLMESESDNNVTLKEVRGEEVGTDIQIQGRMILGGEEDTSLAKFGTFGTPEHFDTLGT